MVHVQSDKLSSHFLTLPDCSQMVTFVVSSTTAQSQFLIDNTLFKQLRASSAMS